MTPWFALVLLLSLQVNCRSSRVQRVDNSEPREDPISSTKSTEDTPFIVIVPSEDKPTTTSGILASALDPSTTVTSDLQHHSSRNHSSRNSVDLRREQQDTSSELSGTKTAPDELKVPVTHERTTTSTISPKDSTVSVLFRTQEGEREYHRNSIWSRNHRNDSSSSRVRSQHRTYHTGLSSHLAKMVLELSKPGAFEKGKSVFDDDAESETTSCPPGDVGLSCRQAEARRGADECSGGNCEECRSCDDMAVTDWPHCCRENFRCCSQLALACQRCDKPALNVFCTKHFKRCS